MRRVLVVLAASALLSLLAGCETTQQESARIAKKLGHQTAVAVTTHVGSANPNIEIDELQLVRSGSATAAAIELTNTSASPQEGIPIVIDAYDAAGREVYSNDTVGTSSPSGELSLLAGRATAWWVDGNVLANGGTPVRLTVKIGLPQLHAPAQLPALSAGGLSAGSNFIGPVIGGTLVNGSGGVASDVTIYAVALAGRRVVGAGQSLVPQIAAGARVSFAVNVTGTAKGAVPIVTVAPARPQ